jgi:putative transposase
MTEYRRFQRPGATWFFTVNFLVEQRGNRLLADHVDALRMAFIDVKRKHPFKIEAAILPDHLHCICTLPERPRFFHSLGTHQGAFFPADCKKGERISKSCEKRG